jgi:PAS domain S-box-containing protein
MSQKRSLKRPLLAPKFVGNYSIDCNSTPHKRRRQTNQALEALGQLIKDPTMDDVDNKLNKNDILSLTLSRLLREKYWSSRLPNRNVQLSAGIESSSLIDELNSFIIVLNSNGRIVLMSDNIECYLRKSVRSLYPQLTSIYDCVNSSDHDSIRRLLSTPINVEQRIICTWNLPRGKRPSRTHTESKSMLMTGHFVLINNEENKEQQEPLFIARCEQILSSTPNIPTNSIGLTNTTTFRFVLTEQLNISEISSNTESLLGYKAEELIDQNMARFVVSEHLQTLEQARQNCIMGQHYTTMNVLDFYTRNGDRLTFLCNTHMLVEGRRKAMKLGFLAQLIDPSVQYECAMYANKQNLERLKNSVQQETTLVSNMKINTSVTTNILSSKNEQCLNFNDLPTVCPVSVIPQRRKRRRINHVTIKSEPISFLDQPQQTPQLHYDSIESQISSSDSLTSSASPIQELGFMDGLFPYIDDIFEYNKIKLIEDFPSIDDINDVFGINNNQQFCLYTPTISTYSFFA